MKEFDNLTLQRQQWKHSGCLHEQIRNKNLRVGKTVYQFLFKAATTFPNTGLLHLPQRRSTLKHSLWKRLLSCCTNCTVKIEVKIQFRHHFSWVCTASGNGSVAPVATSAGRGDLLSSWGNFCWMIGIMKSGLDSNRWLTIVAKHTRQSIIYVLIWSISTVKGTSKSIIIITQLSIMNDLFRYLLETSSRGASRPHFASLMLTEAKVSTEARSAVA